MTTRSHSGHCITPDKFCDGFADEKDDSTKLVIHSASSSEAITMEDTVVSVAVTGSELLEDRKVGWSCSKIFEEREILRDDVRKINEVKESIELNGKESLNSEVDEQERLLQAEKRRLLAEIEGGSIFRKRVDVENLDRDSDVHRLEENGNGSTELHEQMEIVEGKDEFFVDETARYDVCPFYKKGEDHPKRLGTSHNDKEAPRKHKKVGEEPIGSSIVVEGNIENSGKKFRIMYCRKQLETMRFAHIVNQKKIWNDMYASLIPEVVTEYEDFNSLKNQKTSKSNRVRRQPIPECGTGENLGTEQGTEDLTPEDYTEDNDDYNSILKPAFEVYGEPDFSSGPPEDGLEYLRRVRWEAKGIPNVNVAKIDESKYKLKEQSVYMPLIPEISKCPEHLLPVKEWEDSLLSDFTHLRMALSQNGNSFEDEMIPSESLEDLLVEIFNKRLQIDRDESFGEVISDIQGMDSVTRVSRLKKRICLVEKESGLQSSDCKWVVALCASLETPLDADTSACLRGLLRKCASVRAEESLEVGDDDEVVVMANMLITIAGRYFGQMGQ